MTLNVLNPKALQRQLKLVETEITKRQTEIDELNKIRSACLVLLGNAGSELTSESNLEEMPGSGEAEKKTTSKTKDLSPRILDLLRKKETGMTADEIFDSLKGEGVELRGKSPVAQVYSTLEKHPELFLQSENGNWVEVKASGEALN